MNNDNQQASIQTEASARPGDPASPEEWGAHLIDLRRRKIDAVERAGLAKAHIEESVQDIDDDIQRLQAIRTERLAAHPDAAALEDLEDSRAELEHQYQVAAARLAEAWTHPGKTIKTPLGDVTRSTRRSVEVMDAQAACRVLLDSPLAACILDVKVNDKVLVPILDAQELAGLRVKESHSVSVKLA